MQTTSDVVPEPNTPSGPAQVGESAEPPVIATRNELQGVHDAAVPLLKELEKLDGGKIVGEIVATALKLLHDQTNRGDIKLINQSLKELRYALKIFAPFRDTHKISIFGSARTPETAPDYKAAEEFAKAMVAREWMVITGAGGGIMAAGHGGAGPDPSFGLAIRLPFEQRTNEFIEKDEKLINFKYFFTRKLMFVRSSSAIAVFPGGFGTMDEGFEVLTLIQTGKSAMVPIVMVDTPGSEFWSGWQDYVKTHLLDRGLISPADLHLYKITSNVDEAVQEVTQFYANYQSMRYVREDLVLRLKKKPTPEQVDRLNADFKDILLKGKIVASDPLSAESAETLIAHLPRLVLPFNRRDHGRLRQLINLVNTF